MHPEANWFSIPNKSGFSTSNINMFFLSREYQYLNNAVAFSYCEKHSLQKTNDKDFEC